MPWYGVYIYIYIKTRALCPLNSLSLASRYFMPPRIFLQFWARETRHNESFGVNFRRTSHVKVSNDKTQGSN